MVQSNARASFRQALLAAVSIDERIVGLLEGGSGGERRVDQWSDLDVFLFLGADALKQAMLNTAYLGRDVCETLATRHSWDWSRDTAEAVIQMLENNKEISTISSS